MTTLNSKSQVQNLLLVVSGSIAAFKSASLVSLLRKSDRYQVKVVMTESAKKFVGAATFEGLSGEVVYDDLWEPGQMMNHIELGKWADKLVVYPATANLLNSWAKGIASDLAGNVFLAWPQHKPVVLAPAMNPNMWSHFTVQESVLSLKRAGVEVLTPESGSMACGDVGEGRLIEPEVMLARLDRSAESSRAKLLIVYGGTRVPIDGVRSITNFSKGTTGARLCDELSRAGYQVDALRAENSVAPAKGNLQQYFFDTYDDLYLKLQSLLRVNEYEGVVQLAAVSDYRVKTINGVPVPQKGKIESDTSQVIELKPTDKILPKLKSWSKNDPLVVGFKLTLNSSLETAREAVSKVFSRGGVDYVVHNELSALSPTGHPFSISSSEGVVSVGETKEEMAGKLSQLFSSALASKPVNTSLEGRGVDI